MGVVEEVILNFYSVYITLVIIDEAYMHCIQRLLAVIRGILLHVFTTRTMWVYSIISSYRYITMSPTNAIFMLCYQHVAIPS